MITAITRVDVASYLAAVFWIYSLLILARILLSWVTMAWTLPENAALRALVAFVEDVTEPYLRLWRKIIPPLRSQAGVIDLSPILAIFALWLVGDIVVGLIRG